MSAVGAFEAALHHALADPNPLESASQVKAVVQARIEQMDPTVRVQRTTYFNHSFTPDFVLHWPGTPERPMFLRTSEHPQILSEDLSVLESDHPFVFALGRVQQDTQPVRSIDEVAREHGAFVTDAPALDTLIDRGGSPAGRILRNSLAQGGRTALIGDSSASEFIHLVERGLDGAGRLRLADTSEALQVIDERLGEPQALRIRQVMQALWVGADGPQDEFPQSVTSWAGRFDPATLLYLLNLVDSDDADFWRRLGRKIQLSDLPVLAQTNQPANWQKLINNNVQTILAKACTVAENPLQVAEDAESALHWSVHNGLLRFTGPGFICDVAQSKEDLPRSTTASTSSRRKRTISGEGIDTDTFVSRWQGSTVTDVEAADMAEAIVVKAIDTSLTQESLREKMRTLHASPLVTKATVSSPTGAVTVDFVAQTGTAVTNSATVLSDLLRTTIPFLVSLDDGVLRQVAAFLPPGQSGPEQPTLPFDATP